MAKGFRPEQVINGTWGEVWFDNEYLAQVTACKAEVGFKKTAITQVQSLVDGQKITGFDGLLHPVLRKAFTAEGGNPSIYISF